MNYAERIGLVLISLTMSALVIWGNIRCCRDKPLRAKLLITIVLFGLFVWLSPQIYYAYYRVIIEGLPRQLVVAWPPPILDILRYTVFLGPGTLSAHGQGLLFWLMLGFAVFRR